MTTDQDQVHHGARTVSRRWVVGVTAGSALAGLAFRWFRQPWFEQPAEVFRRDAPTGELWEQWLARGWARPARHYLSLGPNVQCKLCPNGCMLEPEDRGRCRNRVNKNGTLYTLTYGAPCALHMDPVEKKPLFHFLPGTQTLSLAASGCGFRCLNCQNWDISQRKPEETKDPHGPALRPRPADLSSLSLGDLARLSLFPEDVVALAQYTRSPSISFTYTEPTVSFEYLIDSARLARAAGLRTVWVTCGYIQAESLAELAPTIDAANVDLKSFRETTYRELNSGKLQPILDCLVALKRAGVWFEVTNLVVPTYTDDLEMIRRMCDWLLANLGPDYPLHFSRFRPEHKLTHLPPTPVSFLVAARDVARKAGLRYVYIGNVRGVPEAETTFCPGCGKAVVEREMYQVVRLDVAGGACRFCGTNIAGVWAA